MKQRNSRQRRNFFRDQAAEELAAERNITERSGVSETN